MVYFKYTRFGWGMVAFAWNILKISNAEEAICHHFKMQQNS